MSASAPPRFRPVDVFAVTACVAAMGIAIVYPTARLAIEAARDWSWEFTKSGPGFEAVRNTLFIGFASVLLAGVVGTGLALYTARFAFPGRRVLSAMAFLPFALPPLVGTLSFYYLIGADGFVPRIAEAWFGIEHLNIEGATAILIIHAYSFFVFFYAMVSAALENMDVSQIEASRTLGASPWMTFRKVTLPMLMPAILGASLLTFMSSGASFSAPLFFGDDFPFLSVEIYKARTQFQEGEALTLTVVLACISLMGVFIFRSRRTAAGSASKGTPRAIKSQGGRIAAGVLAWVLIALLLVPHAVIIFLSFVNHREWYTEVIPTTFTLSNYTDIFTRAESLRPIRNSVWMGLLAALSTLAIGLPAAYLIGRGRPGGRLVNFMVMIPWALPGTVVAMNLIAAFNGETFALYNTIWILPLAYFVRSIPLLTRMATASISQFDATLLEAGRTLGAGPRFCFIHIILPLLAPALVAATALVFATSLGEFVASILLYTSSNLPIAIQINMQWRGSGVGSAFAYGVFLMALVTITFVMSRRFASRII